MVRLQIRHLVAEVESSVARLAGERCPLQLFLEHRRAGNADLALKRVASLGEGARLLEEGSPERGSFELSGSEIRVCIESDPIPAELALRVLFQTATRQQGGLLCHASAAIASGQNACWVALGPSGAGKSTLSRIYRDHCGGEILSDEIVALHEDGSAWGTPFCSEDELTGTAVSGRVSALWWLEQGDHEEVTPIGPADAYSLLSSQTCALANEPPARAELMLRLARLLERPGLTRLTFRDTPEAATFVDEATRGRSGSQDGRRSLA
jgi:hypothetical protein